MEGSPTIFSLQEKKAKLPGLLNVSEQVDTTGERMAGRWYKSPLSRTREPGAQISLRQKWMSSLNRDPSFIVSHPPSDLSSNASICLPASLVTMFSCYSVSSFMLISSANSLPDTAEEYCTTVWPPICPVKLRQKKIKHLICDRKPDPEYQLITLSYRGRVDLNCEQLIF